MKEKTSEPMKLVRLTDSDAVLGLENSERLVEVPESDNGSACGCGCGCKERYYSISGSFCRWCETGACDCSPSAMAARGPTFPETCYFHNQYDCHNQECEDYMNTKQ